MRIILVVLIFLHAAIHLMGFFKGFGLAEIKELTLSISKPMALGWFLGFLLLALGGGLYLFRWPWWWLLVLAGVLVSQLLIFSNWKDARFGSIANLILLLATLPAYFQWRFDQLIDRELQALVLESSPSALQPIDTSTLSTLPPPVARWLRNSGVVGRVPPKRVFLSQRAQMKMKPEDKTWMDAQARQFIFLENPAFLWKVRLKMKGVLPVTGRDRFENGKGWMTIKLFSLIPVVDVQDDPKINEGSLQRFLGEIVWAPFLAVSPYITWQPVDENRAQATMACKGSKGSGIFEFNQEGNFVRFEADRFMGAESGAERFPWIIEAHQHAQMDGINIPVKMKATWKLPGGDWNWLKLEISHAEYKDSRVKFD